MKDRSPPSVVETRYDGYNSRHTANFSSSQQNEKIAGASDSLVCDIDDFLHLLHEEYTDHAPEISLDDLLFFSARSTVRGVPLLCLSLEDKRKIDSILVGTNLRKKECRKGTWVWEWDELYIVPFLVGWLKSICFFFVLGCPIEVFLIFSIPCVIEIDSFDNDIVKKFDVSTLGDMQHSSFRIRNNLDMDRLDSYTSEDENIGFEDGDDTMSMNNVEGSSLPALSSVNLSRARSIAQNFRGIPICVCAYNRTQAHDLARALLRVGSKWVSVFWLHD